MVLTVVFAVAAAFSNAVNVMTQHSASVAAPKREKGFRLVGYLFRQPVWLLGWIAAVGGFAFQALALHDGQISVVQPILITELVFVLVLRRVWIRQDVARAAWVAVFVVCVALGVFLAVAMRMPRRRNGCPPCSRSARRSRCWPWRGCGARRCAGPRPLRWRARWPGP
jgi:hypothetical protein